MGRRIIGLAVWVLGTAGLGIWGSLVSAPQIEHQIRNAAMAALTHAAPEDDLQLTVSGRDIDVSGLVTSEAGAFGVMAALDAVAGRRTVRSTMQDLAIAAPYVMSAEIQGGSISATGVVPSEAVRARLAAVLGAAAQDLTLAAGAPMGWDETALAGLKALSLLHKGKVSIEGQTVILVGEVIDAEGLRNIETALDPAPLVVKDITVLDDGMPVAYTLRYSAGTGGVLQGKLPFGITPDAVATALGLPSIAGDVKTALIREMGDIRYLSAWGAVLPQIETLSSEVGPSLRLVQAKLREGADAQAVRAALATGGFIVELEPPPAPEPEPVPAPEPQPAPVLVPLPEPNLAPTPTPILDQMTVPMSPLGFEITPSGCQGATDALLGQNTIIFLPNLDQLDDSALTILTDLAAIVRDCAGGGLMAEIGGHTDISGDPAENLALSARRAEAVRTALATLGVPLGQMTAKGYGDTLPISENITKEGRIKNRRITVLWGN